MRLKKIKEWSIFDSMFGFESGIDIANDTEVLFRKNTVIKNIIFLSNLIYTFIFMIVSIGDQSNWVLTLICLPLTFFVNNFLKGMIYKNPKDLLKQQIAMYIACFYMFLTAILIYFKLKTGSESYLGEVGYILLYYSLVVCSLYQDKKMLKNVFQVLLIIITVLHFTLTYNIVGEEYANDLLGFIQNFFISKEFRDIFLRTIILCVFYLVVYAIVSMTGYMQEERRKELLKRREIQEDFIKVINEIFDVTLNQNVRSNDDIMQINILSNMSNKLASIMGLNPQKCNEIKEYALCHVTLNINFKKQDNMNEEEYFELLRTKTTSGSIVIRRIQLERKTEDIIRAHMEESNNDEFSMKMKSIQNNLESQIIMLCDMYITLRSIRSYKKAYSHRITMQYLEEQFKEYYDVNLFDRFIKFQHDFEEIYDNN